MSVMRELSSLSQLVLSGAGKAEIIPQNGKIVIRWLGRDGCEISGEDIEDCLYGRYFQNEITSYPR